MSVSQEGDPARDIFYVNFNQSGTALCVGARSGFNLYDLTTVYECLPTYESRIDPEKQEKSGHRISYLGKDLKLLQDVCIIERNFSTALVAFVKLEKPRNVFLYNYSKGAVIIQRAFPNTVLSVKLNRNHVVVCLEDKIYILNIQNLSEDNVHVITDTATNLKGLTALTYGSDLSPTLLAYPGSAAQGHVQIFDAGNKHAKMTIPAHTSRLAALAFDEEGAKLATASIKGTVIRVYSVASGDVLFEFRRGVKRCAEIHCLFFNRNPELLCASSNTETIHIFKLCSAETVEPPREESEGWMEMFGRVLLSQSTHYLPTQVSDVLTQPRSFAHIHLPFVEQKTVCAIMQIKHIPYIMVASLEGFLYIYDINVEVGGACHLVKQHRIEGPRHKQEAFASSLGSLKSSQGSLDPEEPTRTSPALLPISSLKSIPAICNIAHNQRQRNVSFGESRITSVWTDANVDPTDCLEPQIVNTQSEDTSLTPSCPNTDLPDLDFLGSYSTELCVSNEDKYSHDKIALVFTEVEQ